jgi:TolB protein
MKKLIFILMVGSLFAQAENTAISDSLYLEGGQFYIGVMETNGLNERMIAKSFHVEGPTWSPNGRYLMYFKEERTAEDGSGGESSLYSIDLTGYNERKIITPLGGSDPAWSPLMH